MCMCVCMCIISYEFYTTSLKQSLWRWKISLQSINNNFIMHPAAPVENARPYNIREYTHMSQRKLCNCPKPVNKT